MARATSSISGTSRHLDRSEELVAHSSPGDVLDLLRRCNTDMEAKSQGEMTAGTVALAARETRTLTELKGPGMIRDLGFDVAVESAAALGEQGSAIQ